MTDITTNKPLRVTDSSAGPYLMLPLTQLDEVRQLLDSRGIRYWVDENAVSLNEGPYIAVIRFGRDGDAAAIQALFDSVG